MEGLARDQIAEPNNERHYGIRNLVKSELTAPTLYDIGT